MKTAPEPCCGVRISGRTALPSPLEHPAVRLVETQLTLAAPNGKAVLSPGDGAALLHRVIGRSDREEFAVLLLNARHRVTHAQVVSRGTLSNTTVHPREVFKAAILANAAAIVVGHNHPSGDPQESVDDARVTARLREAGTLLGIEVLDAIIVTPQGAYYSTADARVSQLREVPDGP